MVGVLLLLMGFSGCSQVRARFQEPAPGLEAAALVLEASPTSRPTATAPPQPTVTPSPTATPMLPPPEVRLFLQPHPVVQGHTLLVYLVASRPVSVTGTLHDQPLSFVKTAPGEYGTLAGIHPLLEPGTYELALQVVDDLGRPISHRTAVEVVNGNYDTEMIHLAPDVAALLNPEAVQAELEKLQKIWAVFSPNKRWDGIWIQPVEGRTTSAFGTRRSYNGEPVRSSHTGQDFGAARGIPVVAPAAGVVTLAEPLHVRGNSVWLDHGLGVHSGYFHLSEILVQEGQKVAQGDLLGRVGSTGLSTGPHLHWEVRVHGIPVDPLAWTAHAMDLFPEWGADE